jgi:spore coat polysaccharide biosynthesis protein SpsF
MVRVVSIIQARTGSTRLPGKVLMNLAGEPMLLRVVNRTRRAQSVDEAVVATTDRQEDRPIVDLCTKHGWPYFCGSEENVLDRYFKTAQEYRADVVVRVTSDCPIIDPELIDLHIERMLRGWQDVDFVTNMLPQSFPLGLAVEVMPFDILRRLHRLSNTDTLREHVTTLIYEKPHLFAIDHILNDVDLSHMRWTVDTQEDLQFVRCLYDYFGHDRFSWRDVLSLLEGHPEWLEINRHVSQKAI